MIWGVNVPGGPQHAWGRTDEGRYKSACPFLPVRWTRPAADPTASRCPHCVRSFEYRPKEAIGRVLAVRWPRGLSPSVISEKAHVWNWQELDALLREMVAEGSLLFAETPAGRRVYAARRKLVEGLKEEAS